MIDLEGTAAFGHVPKNVHVTLEYSGIVTAENYDPTPRTIKTSSGPVGAAKSASPTITVDAVSSGCTCIGIAATAHAVNSRRAITGRSCGSADTRHPELRPGVDAGANGHVAVGLEYEHRFGGEICVKGETGPKDRFNARVSVAKEQIRDIAGVVIVISATNYCVSGIYVELEGGRCRTHSQSAGDIETSCEVIVGCELRHPGGVEIQRHRTAGATAGKIRPRCYTRDCSRATRGCANP